MAKSSRRKSRKTAGTGRSTSRTTRDFDPVKKDPIDLRDRMYEPTLSEVPYHIDNRDAVPFILDQGREGACTGYALAAVVNFLLANRNDAQPPEESVSARMLYEMAKRYDEWEGEAYEGSSIRGAMKGWNRHGACRESLWGTATRSITTEAQWDALNRPLGAYYRVRHLHLAEMHAALSEVGILYASASVHEGWRAVDSNGKIPYSRDKIGGHAFAVVGYDEEGFWCVNSWGSRWGADGFCHISYDDWLENGWDCWVARLGVPTFSAAVRGEAERDRVSSFDYIPHENVVMAEIKPHYVNLGNDGVISESGRYSNDRSDVRRVFREPIPQWGEDTNGSKHLLLFAHGGLNSEKASASRIASLKPYFLANGIYPVHFMWETGLEETVLGIVQDAFRKKRFQGWRDSFTERFYDLLDEGIELGAKPLGRPLWRQMKDNAKRASGVRGGASFVAREIKRLFDTEGPTDLHLVGHSAGGIFHSWLVPRLLAQGLKIKTLTFYAPACSVDLFKENVGPGLARAQSAIQRITIFHLNDSTARADSVGNIYRKSLLYLVSEAFEERRHTPLLGMDKFAQEDVDLSRLLGTGDPSGASTTVYSKGGASVELISKSKTHGDFDNDVDTLNSTMRIILGSNHLTKEFPTHSS